MANQKLVEETLGKKNRVNVVKKDKVNYLGEARIVGTVLSGYNGVLIGYMVMVEKTKVFKPMTIDMTKTMLKKFKFVNATINLDGKIVNTECSMDRLMVFNQNMEVIKNAGIYIIAEIKVQGKNERMFQVMNKAGKIAELTEVDLLRYAVANNAEIINARIVKTDGKKPYISAIKQKFTVIERTQEEQRTVEEKGYTDKDKWRFKKHRDRLVHHYGEYIIKTIFKGREIKALSNSLFPFMYAQSKNSKMQRGYNLVKEATIIEKEVLEPLIKQTDNKEAIMLRDFIAEHKGNCREVLEYGFVLNEEEKRIVYAIGQASLLKLSSEEIVNDYKIVMNKAICRGTKIQIPEVIQGVIETSTLVKLIDRVNSEIDKRDYEEEEKRRLIEKKKFNITSFKSSQEIAEMGFAISEANKGIEWETQRGTTMTLKYLGDYIGEEYHMYKSMSTCLGDLLIIANIERIEELMKLRRVKKEEALCKIELMLGILAIYNPELCKQYKDNKENKANSEYFKNFLPEFDFTAEPMCNALDSRIRLYYESGCCVYYNDNSMDGAGNFPRRREYRFRDSREAEVINFRSKGVHHIIMHDDLYKELLPVLWSITSYTSNYNQAINCIGALRAI